MRELRKECHTRRSVVEAQRKAKKASFKRAQAFYDALISRQQEIENNRRYPIPQCELILRKPRLPKLELSACRDECDNYRIHIGQGDFVLGYQITNLGIERELARAYF